MKVLTFRDTLVQENASHEILRKVICESIGHDPQPFIVKSTGEEMRDWAYCRRCLGTLQRLNQDGEAV